jgi:hypothetical protein
MYVTIQRTIERQKVWMRLDDGIEIANLLSIPTMGKTTEVNYGKTAVVKTPKGNRKAAGIV